jgi:hypothetical protein
LAEPHLDRYAEAIEYEKTALNDGSPFIWSQSESLTDLAEQSLVAQIKFDYNKRRDRLRQKRRINPPSFQAAETVDNVYGIYEEEAVCVILP